MRRNARGYKVLLVLLIFALSAAFCPNLKGESPVPPQKITLDVKGMDVIDFLKMISQQSGMNIVASKNVTGRVTIFLKDVNAWDAFEIVLLSNDLAYEVKGDIVSVMTGREYETQYGERFRDKKEVGIVKLNYMKAVEISKTLTQVKSAIGKVVIDEGSNTLILMDTPEKISRMEEMIKGMDVPVQTRVFALDYAKSDKLNAKIQDMLTKGVGTMRFDERTNKIIVTDLPAKITEIDEVVNAFDEKTRQVLIDAKIVQVELNDEFNSGVNWDTILDELKVEQTLLAGLDMGGKLTISTLLFGDKTKPLNAVIDLLRTTGKTNIISTPRITAIEGQEAKILIGTKEAYITGTTTTPGTGATTTAESVNFVDVGVQLYVTPTINKEGFITMKIRPVISSVGDYIPTTASPRGVPIIKTSEAETSIIVRDGVTIIMGGLMEDKKSSKITKFPILGDIPILGFPFRKTSETVKKTELVIFLTPTIISGNSNEFAQRPPAELNYSQYYDIIRQMILDTAMRHSSQSSISGTAKVLFYLASDGYLKGEPKLIGPARPEMKDLALRSVKESAPFPPFPKSFKEETESFSITISCE
jgi:type IV pilus assembly protein PilQ